MTRVAQMTLQRNVLEFNQRNLERASLLQQDLSSGKRVRALSDDPIAGKRILGYRVDQFETDRWLQNIDKTLAFANATDSTLTNIAVIFDEAKALAVKGANASENVDTRGAIGRSIGALLDRVVDLANTVHDGRYIFAGTAVTQRPFELSSDGSRVDYRGDLDRLEVQISQSTRARVNENGHELFKEEIDMFAAFIDLRDALLDDDPQRVEALIDDLDTAQRHLGNIHGALGGRVERVELTRSQLEEAQVTVGTLMSEQQDVDMAETIMELQIAETALQAGLNAGARVIQPTLLQFL